MRSTNHALGMLCLVFSCFLFSISLHAQVTTATLSGLVKNAKGEPLAGATVTISYPDAGIRLTVKARSDGHFTIPNLRVGGPYSVMASFVNLEPQQADNLFLELGQNNT